MGEISIGRGEQQSIDESLAPIEGVLLNADIIWLPTPLTMVEFIARSEVDTASLVDSLGGIDRFYELSIQHAFWRYLVIGGYVSYEIADNAASPLVDQRLKEDLRPSIISTRMRRSMPASSIRTSPRPRRITTSIRTRCGSECGSDARSAF